MGSRRTPENRSPRVDPARAVAYIRVSTEEQRIGPTAQRDAIEAWSTREGIEVVGWHVDHGISGKTPPGKRPALTAGLAALHEEGAGVLVVAKRDRLARDVMVAGFVEMKVRQAGARVVSVAGEGTGDDSPTGRLMAQIIDAFAEYERQIIASRTRAALQAKKIRGERVGTVPWGFRETADGKLVSDKNEQLVIARVKDLREDGASIRGIVRCLDSHPEPAIGDSPPPTQTWERGCLVSMDFVGEDAHGLADYVGSDTLTVTLSCGGHVVNTQTVKPQTKMCYG